MDNMKKAIKQVVREKAEGKIFFPLAERMGLTISKYSLKLSLKYSVASYIHLGQYLAYMFPKIFVLVMLWPGSSLAADNQNYIQNSSGPTTHPAKVTDAVAKSVFSSKDKDTGDNGWVVSSALAGVASLSIPERGPSHGPVATEQLAAAIPHIFVHSSAMDSHDTKGDDMGGNTGRNMGRNDGGNAKKSRGDNVAGKGINGIGKGATKDSPKSGKAKP